MLPMTSYTDARARARVRSQLVRRIIIIIIYVTGPTTGLRARGDAPSSYVPVLFFCRPTTRRAYRITGHCAGRRRA